jgi:hypothetical protein
MEEINILNEYMILCAEKIDLLSPWSLRESRMSIITHRDKHTTTTTTIWLIPTTITKSAPTTKSAL